MKTKMNVVFLTNCYNHHQSAMAEALWNETCGEFHFIETELMTQERKNMGWGEKDYPSYVITYDCYRGKRYEVQNIIDSADVVIMGSAPDELLLNRLSDGKLTFRYSERMFKNKCPNWQIPLRIMKNYYRFGRYKSEYLLCSSGYTAGDFAKVKTFIGKCYKWGYFPEVKRYDVADLMSRKLSVTFGWKHRGAKYQAGEDTLFIQQCLRRGLKAVSVQEVLGVVEQQESTWFKGCNEKYFYDKGVLLSACFGKWARLLLLLLLIKNKNETNEVGFAKAVKCSFSGVRDYHKS